MTQYSLQSFIMASGDQTCRAIDFDSATLFALVCLNACCNVLEANTAESTGGLGSFAQLEHELTHSFDCMVDGHQHVLLEFRVVAVALGILQHQRQLGNDVLQVMHHEG